MIVLKQGAKHFSVTLQTPHKPRVWDNQKWQHNLYLKIGDSHFFSQNLTNIGDTIIGLYNTTQYLFFQTSFYITLVPQDFTAEAKAWKVRNPCKRLTTSSDALDFSLTGAEETTQVIFVHPKSGKI